MKWKCILSLCILSALMMISPCYAEGTENYKDYIVYLRPQSRVFGTENSTENNRNYISATKDELDGYLSQGMVAFYEPDYEIKLFEDFYSETQYRWNMSSVNARKAWDTGCFGNDIKVAVIDSGAYPDPDLSANLLVGHNYIDNNDDTSDNIGHGTFVSGIIAGACTDERFIGVAYKSKVIPLKCFDTGKTTKVSMIADAIYDAVDVYGADVINMSFGMSETSSTQTVKSAVEYAVNKGCILVAAVGNDGTQTVYCPAKYDNVVGVGSVDSDLGKSSFSQHNITVDVVAPGGGVTSISIPGYTKNNGTSFATPHVSAMAAIAKCIDKNIDAVQFQRILEETSTDLGDAGYETYYGYGLINIEAMINKMLENVDMFISPVDDEGENVTVTVYNNTDTVSSGVGIAASFEQNEFKDMKKENISLLPKETAKISAAKENNVKFMLLESFDSLKPLFKAKVYINKETQ